MEINQKNQKPGRHSGQSLGGTPESSQGDGPGVVGLAFWMALGSLTSRVLGLLREILLAAFFDRTITDLWVLAFRWPNFFRRLLGEGAFSFSFVPRFHHLQEAEGRVPDGAGAERLKTFVSESGSLMLILAGGLTALGMIFPEFFVQWLVDSKGSDGASAELLISWTRWMFGFIFLVTGAAVSAATMNALGAFVWTAAVPLFFNVALILSTIFVYIFSWNASGLIYGVLIGGALQWLVLGLALRKIYQPPGFSWKIFRLSPDVYLLFVDIFPSVISMAFVQALFLINTRAASALGSGAVSYLYWGDRFLELPLTLFAVNTSQILLQVLSQQWGQKNYRQWQESFQRTMGGSLFLVSSAAIGLFCLSNSIIQLLFERGLFTAVETKIAGESLRWMSLCLVPWTAIRIYMCAFASVRRLKEVSWICTGAVVFYTLTVGSIHIYGHGLVDLALKTLSLSGVVWGILAWRWHKLFQQSFPAEVARGWNTERSKTLLKYAVVLIWLFVSTYQLNFWIESGRGNFQIGLRLFLTIFIEICLWVAAGFLLNIEPIKSKAQTAWRKILD